MKKKWIFMIAGAATAILAPAFAALAGEKLARQTALPKTLSLEDEEKWEKERNLWGNFDELPREKWTVSGMNGYELHCETIAAAEPSDRYVILSHGYTSNRYGSVKYLGVYRSLGFNCIIYDVRGHGENEKTAVSLGQFESRDLLMLIQEVYDRYGSDIILGLHGESMGSAISLSVLAYDPDLKFVVADCGFSNLYDLMRELTRAKHLGFMLPLVNYAMKRSYGYDMKETDPESAIAQTIVPICLIHGSEDGFINAEHSRRLKRAAGGYCELNIVQGARHAQSRELKGEKEYRKIIAEFLRRIDLINDTEAAQQKGPQL